jgi:prepilin-type processing-associated H-X9-DG protein
MRRLFCFLTVVVLTIAFVPAAARAQALVDKIPDDAVIYIGWAGTDNLGAAYEGSHLKAVVDSTDWNDFVTRFIPAVMNKVAGEAPDAAEFSKAFSALATPAWKHPTAIYFGGIDFTNRRNPQPRIAVYCQAGDDAPAMEAALNDLVAQAPKGRGEPAMSVTTANGLVTFIIGQPAAEGKALGDSPAFQSALAQGVKQPLMVAYVNGEKLTAMIDEGVAQNSPPQMAQRWTDVRDALGLAGLKGAIWTAGFDGKDWANAAFIDAPAPRAGLLQILDTKPITDDILKKIPVSATMAWAGRSNFSGLLKAIREGGEKVDPDFPQMYETGMDFVRGMLGVDLEELAAPFGDQWAMFVDPNTGGNSVLGLTVVNKLNDPAKALDVLTKAEAGINRVAKRYMPSREITIQFISAKRVGVEIHYLAVPIVTPSWAIDGDMWYFGLYPQTVASAVANAKVGGKSILDNPAYIDMRKRLGQEQASLVQFVDAPKLVKDNYAFWIFLSRYAGFGDVFGIDSPLMLLPPMHTLIAEQSAGGGVTWTDAKGWHSRSITSFPGSELLSGNPMAMSSLATPAVMASVLLPSLNRARETANRVKSASNLRQIGLALLMYSNENRNRYPKDLGELVTTEDIGAGVFTNPRLGSGVPPNIKNADPTAQAQWVNDNSDYVYKGAGKNSSMGPEEVLAYEKPDGLSDGINILYGDGHVTFVPMSQAMQLIRR